MDVFSCSRFSVTLLLAVYYATQYDSLITHMISVRLRKCIADIPVLNFMCNKIFYVFLNALSQSVKHLLNDLWGNDFKMFAFQNFLH
jgi:hypothetical protein